MDIPVRRGVSTLYRYRIKRPGGAPNISIDAGEIMLINQRFMVLLLLLLASVSVGAATPEALFTRDLHAEAARIDARQLPLMLVFSSHDCPFCTRLRREFLQPMQRSGDYVERVIMRELMLDEGGAVRGFDDSFTDARQLAEHYKVQVTPTILFLDAQGNELSERLVGLGTVDFFGWYLDDAINSARQQLRSQPVR